MMFKPRPKQADVLAYSGGRMGVSAVPGSGKTHTLSALAANLISGKHLQDHQEVLIVTLVNSAVDNFSRRIGDFIKGRGLLPNLGYRVRTLHGLANDIVRERPALVGVDRDFKIIDEREGDDILRDAVTAWTGAHPEIATEYFDVGMKEGQVNFVLQNRWPREAMQITQAFIKQAKDMRLSPEDIRRGLDRYPHPLPLAAMCHAIYVNYAHSLSYRGGVDFQDLIVLATRALEADEDYLNRLRQRWPYILEDEAQDSSRLQQNILEALVGKEGNWVRVGDPNQAIYETFTTAKPEYLRDFLQMPNVQARELPNSGRSTESVIALANALIDWTQQKHPQEAIRLRRPLDVPYIIPAPPDDPQPNPPDNPAQIHLRPERYTPQEEIEAIVKSAKVWAKHNKDKTAAVLVPRNDRGAAVVKALRAEGVEVIELLRSTSTTRETAGALALLLEALSSPNSAPQMAAAFKVWRRDDREEPETNERLEQIVKALRRCKHVEDYLHPRADNDWMDGEVVADLTQDSEVIGDQLLAFRDLMRRWQGAVVLPVDQLVLTLGQDLFVTAADLAIAHSLAVYLRRQGAVNAHWRLPDFAVELRAIALNKRRVRSFDEEATGFDPNDDKHKGKVTVATMHAAKGLEWDRVYLTSVNAYNFPSALLGDQYIGEKWFVRDKLNLQAEALEQLKRLADTIPFEYEEGKASEDARIEYTAERLRLLFVGITRAKQELVITWNSGRKREVLEASPLVALRHWWAEQKR
jgi:DNA helicase II / ATP-dependent DNA helicase PcrA